MKFFKWDDTALHRNRNFKEDTSYLRQDYPVCLSIRLTCAHIVFRQGHFLHYEPVTLPMELSRER